jgi:hypothetical protein
MKLAYKTTGIKVAGVALAKKPLPEMAYRGAVEGIIGEGPIESCPTRLCQTLVPVAYHGFLACVERAFSDHRPLVMSPDHIWLLICQGFANHVNANAETLRKQLVSFEGKEKLVVQRDDFVKGSMVNDWEGVFPEFIEKMRGFMGARADLLAAEFSTTGNVERAACQITMMEAMKAYIDYRVLTMCGIPEIILEGTVEDWQTLRAQARRLSEFGLEWWTKPLDGALANFCQTVEGYGERDWWNSFYKMQSESGGEYVTGHVLKFFPYLKENPRAEQANVRNNFPEAATHDCLGVSQPYLPSGLSKVPFIWNYFFTLIPMEFVSGFVGMRQDAQTMAVRPEIGWAVRDAQKVVRPPGN